MHVANRSSGGSTHALGSSFIELVDAAVRGRRSGITDSAATIAVLSVAVVLEKAEAILSELYLARGLSTKKLDCAHITRDTERKTRPCHIESKSLGVRG